MLFIRLAGTRSLRGLMEMKQHKKKIENDVGRLLIPQVGVSA